MLEFKINDYLTLKLEKGRTNIYINDEKFEFYCERLVVVIQSDNLSNFDDLESIDDLNHDQSSLSISILPKEEFWGHCSNLQSWVENEYNTTILHSSLSFPLLKKLTEVGDPVANKYFKDEIGKRFISKNPSTSIFLIEEDYLNFLNDEEFATLIDSYKDFVKRTEIERIDIYEILGLSYFSRCHNYLKTQKFIELDNFFQTAKNWFESAIDIDPNNETVWKNFGCALMKMDKYEEAIKKFQKSLEINPNDDTTWNSFGYALMELDKYEEAITKFQKSLAINPNNDRIWKIFGYTLLKLDKFERAIEKFQKALTINPNDDAAWNGYGVA